MQTFPIMFTIYTVRGVAGLVNYWMAFEYFFSFRSYKWKNTKCIWIAVYFLINYLYRPIINFGPRPLYFVIWTLYLVRVVPFLWTKYGRKLTFIVIALFYGNLIDCIAQNIQILFMENNGVEIYRSFKADISVMITELIVFFILVLFIILKRVNVIKLYFTKLTIAEYILLFLMNMSFAILEAGLFKSDSVSDPIKRQCIVSYLLLTMLIIHVIMVREQNTSMNTMIGNLKEPMKQITDSYIEMNEKSTELRRFRHDTKNLLLVLQSLVLDDKKEQAVEYIEKMQGTLDTINVKAFDTGNFIADALLESKSKLATQNDIVMTVTGNIPADKIEDVNLVILISNLVDNAIEATRQAEGEKKIEIQSILKKNIWILSVKNPCVNDVVIRENRIETTKDDRESHGFGLSNIERVIKKYDGDLKLKCEDKVFTAIATLMLAA